ncbi:hypothetical protein MGALJ_56050 [Mycobacterium gallinarum]|uniref:Uncharacterized protein n=1 Tax=Mycobacterium gallinarum TaxID=39689 RepID=A0A9W4FIA3_9MYCO|nr:hypothetical protein MGALJ_56050 [Mycobacterium gallinarum]
MNSGRVRYRDDPVALGAPEAELRDGTRAVGEQSLSIPGIGPGAGDHLGAVEWSHVRLIVFDHLVDHSGIDDPFFHEQGFERLDPRCHCVAHTASRYDS